MNKCFNQLFIFACGFGAALAGAFVLAQLKKKKKQNYYENDEVLHQYLYMHYNLSHEKIDYDTNILNGREFDERCVAAIAKFINLDEVHDKTALDIGCAVGRLAFELSKYFGSVEAIDSSERFIEVCNLLKKNGRLSYEFRMDGHRTRNSEAVVKGGDPSKVIFKRMDALKIKIPHRFDCICAVNLIDRLKEPKRFLQQLKELVNSGCIVLLVSPYTWTSKFTSQDKWLTNAPPGKQALLSSGDVVKEEMSSAGFGLLEESNIPFLIQETQRKFQFGIAHLTLWIFH